jgi:hypothetical protein
MFYHYNTRINTITREPEESKEDNDISDIYNDPDHPKEESDEEDHELPPLESDKLMRKSENIDKKGIRDILTRKLSVGERHSYKSTTNKVNPMYYS